MFRYLFRSQRKQNIKINSHKKQESNNNKIKKLENKTVTSADFLLQSKFPMNLSTRS